MQLYYAGLPVLLNHLKITRPRRSVDASLTKTLGGDLAAFDLFDAALPDYGPLAIKA